MSKSATEHKIGFYLDYSELKAADSDHDSNAGTTAIDWKVCKLPVGFQVS